MPSPTQHSGPRCRWGPDVVIHPNPGARSLALTRQVWFGLFAARPVSLPAVCRYIGVRGVSDGACGPSLSRVLQTALNLVPSALGGLDSSTAG